jgi:hypothetical protein
MAFLPLFSDELTLTEQERAIDSAAELMFAEGREPLCFCLLCAPISVEIMRRKDELQRILGHDRR